MKRPFSICFLLLFLFNLVGYYGVYLGLKVSVKQEMRARLDAEAYSEDETLTIKLPFALPYQNDWASYERIDGKPTRSSGIAGEHFIRRLNGLSKCLKLWLL
ncbi:MAG: hypothetical protein HWD62_10745 [Cyclobacteriaceae bacterium]|nr:MAG: hypothetical protein HWD62_10745 [Cyclobacteriaceae bacterium]